MKSNANKEVTSIINQLPTVSAGVGFAVTTSSYWYSLSIEEVLHPSRKPNSIFLKRFIDHQVQQVVITNKALAHRAICRDLVPISPANVAVV